MLPKTNRTRMSGSATARWQEWVHSLHEWLWINCRNMSCLRHVFTDVFLSEMSIYYKFDLLTEVSKKYWWAVSLSYWEAAQQAMPCELFFFTIRVSVSPKYFGTCFFQTRPLCCQSMKMLSSVLPPQLFKARRKTESRTASGLKHFLSSSLMSQRKVTSNAGRNFPGVIVVVGMDTQLNFCLGISCDWNCKLCTIRVGLLYVGMPVISYHCNWSSADSVQPLKVVRGGCFL